MTVEEFERKLKWTKIFCIAIGIIMIVSFIAGILLMLRYNESWILYLVNNVLDLTLWIINFSSGGFDSLMVLLMSVMYLVINI